MLRETVTERERERHASGQAWLSGDHGSVYFARMPLPCVRLEPRTTSANNSQSQAPIRLPVGIKRTTNRSNIKKIRAYVKTLGSLLQAIKPTLERISDTKRQSSFMLSSGCKPRQPDKGPATGRTSHHYNFHW